MHLTTNASLLFENLQQPKNKLNYINSSDLKTTVTRNRKKQDSVI